MSYNPDEPNQTVQQELDATIAELQRTREQLAVADARGNHFLERYRVSCLSPDPDVIEKAMNDAGFPAMVSERDHLRAELAKTREELAKATRERDDLHALNGQRVHERDTLRAELARINREWQITKDSWKIEHTIREMAESQLSAEQAKVKMLEAVTRDLIESFRRYEMDVDSAPTHEHCKLMERAHAALAAAPEEKP